MKYHDIEHLMLNTLTVGEVLDLLEGHNRDAKVLIVTDYGDISHTQQCLPFSDAEELDPAIERLEESGYSHSGVALQAIEDDDDGEQADDQPEVVLIKVC